jgi:adenine-specific DNA-methyltransferase
VNGEQPIIMDFFAGSGSSGEAVMRLAANGMAGARYIGVQLPEAVNPKERTGKAALAKGWETITQVTRERLRRVLALPEIAPSNQGFRAFRLCASNIRRWTGVEEKTAEAYLKQMEAFADTLVPGWKPEDVIWEVALREGFPLTASVVKLTKNALPKCWRVSDAESERAFTICLAETLDLEGVKPLGLTKDDMFVCRDTALTDTVAANLALQCRLKVL